MNLSVSCNSILIRHWNWFLGCFVLISFLLMGPGLNAASPKITKYSTGQSFPWDPEGDQLNGLSTIKAHTGMLHELPDPESVILEKLGSGDIVAKLGRSGAWYAVRLANDRLGWVHESVFDEGRPFARSDTPPNSKFIRKYVKVMVKTARVRSLNSFQATIAFRLPKNTRVAVTDIKGEWYFIHTDDGQRGWLHQIFVDGLDGSQPMPPQKDPVSAGAQDTRTSAETAVTITGGAALKPPKDLVVMIEKAAMYQGPTIDSKIVTTLPKQRSVELLDTAKDWYLVKSPPNQTGWMHRRLFDPPPVATPLEKPAQEGPPAPGTSVENTPDKQMVRVAVTVGRIRQAPDLKSSILARLDKGTLLERVDQKRDWYQVRLADDRLGWAHRIVFEQVSAPDRPTHVPTARPPQPPRTDSGLPKISLLRFKEKDADGIEKVMVLLEGEGLEAPIVELYNEKDEKPRAVCDFMGVGLGPFISSDFEAEGVFVKRIRVAQHHKPRVKTRLVVDLQPGSRHEIQQFFYPSEKKFSLVFLPKKD